MSTNLDGTPRNGGRLRADAVLDEDHVWMELVEQVGALGVRDGLISIGRPAAQAAGIAFWLEDQRRLSRVVDRSTATAYRKILRAIEPDQVKRAIPGYINVPRIEQQFPLFRELAGAAA